MSANHSDRNLLFGMLALQMSLIDRDTLFAAMQAWVFDRSKPLGQILQEQGKLAPERRQALDLMITAQLQAHTGDEMATVPADDVAGSVADPRHTVVYGAAAPGLRYEVLRPHARGGLGEVFVALDLELHREVALKEIQSRYAGDSANRSRFVLEAEITGGLEHPGIVPVYGLGQYPDGRPYYAMRFIQGDSLKDAIVRLHKGDTGVTLRGLLARFVTVCNTVAYAHSRGVLHRDLKPANVMLGKYGETLIVDWGLAKAIGHELAESARTGFSEITLQPHSGDSSVETLMGSAIGTPAYMCPEQAAGRLDLLGPAADIYSLGATLYTILTGQAPVEGPDEGEVLKKVRDGDFPPPRQLNPSVPPALDAVCRKAMAQNPKERYPTALALAIDVEAWLAGEPVSAWPEPWVVRGRRWLARHQALASAAAAVVMVATLALGAGVVLLTAANERERLARDDERLARQTAERKEEEASQQRDEAQRQRDAARYHLYLVHMNMAQMAGEDTNLALALDLLKLYAQPQTAQADLRGWEWYYQQRLFRSELRTLQGHKSDVNCVAFSPDGTRLASASDDRTIKLWDMASGEAARTLEGHTGLVAWVAFSPDGTRLASVSDDQTLRLWETATGRLLRTLPGHTDRLRSVAFSPDGTRLASAGYDQAVILWDAATGKVLHTLKGHTEVVRQVKFSPDGRRLATAGRDGMVKLWEAAGGQLLHTLPGHKTEVRTVAFHPDGRRLATAGRDGTVKLWEAAGGQELRALSGHKGEVRDLVFSPDGQLLASAGHDRTVRLWDAASGRELCSYLGHTQGIYSVAFSPDGLWLASAGEDATIKVWDTLPRPEPRSLEGYSAQVRGVAFSPDGTQLASVTLDGTINLWDMVTGQETRSVSRHGRSLLAVAFHRDGQQLALARDDGAVALVDALTGQSLRVLPGHTKWVSGVALSVDGKLLASASEDRLVKVWDVASGRELRTLTGHTRGVSGVAFHPDGKQLASAGRDHLVKIWDAVSGDERHTLPGHGNGARSLAYSADGTRLAVGCGDGTVNVWDAAGGQELYSLKGHTDNVWSVAFSPDGKRLASASFDQTVKVWDPATGQEVRTLKGHDHRVLSVAFSPAGHLLVSAGEDRTVKIWDARPLTPETQLEREATALLQALFARPLARDDVLEYLRTAPAIGPALQQRALALVARYREVQDPGRYREAAWAIVRQPHLSRPLYQLALSQARSVCRLAPDDPPGLTALSAAQYRMGQDAEALATLTRSDRLGKGLHPACLAFLALVHHRLGQAGEAQAALARLRERVQSPDLRRDEEALALLAEVEAQVGKSGK